MTRQETTETYDVNDQNVITSPGKFEGEIIYAPHFTEMSVYGEELAFIRDGCGCYTSLIKIDADDIKEFPEITGNEYVLLTEYDRGFIYLKLVKDEIEADKIRKEYEVKSTNENDFQA